MIQENNPEVLKTLDGYSNCINELLHQGFEILKNVRESSFSNEEHASFILLFRETLAFVDAIVPLIRLPSKEGVSIILRKPFKSIDQEYKRIKKVNGKPKWYSLWDGPRTIEDLFRYMNRPIIYEEIYRTWSGIVHPNASFS